MSGLNICFSIFLTQVSHCPAGIFKNIISNVTKNEEAGHGLTPVPADSRTMCTEVPGLCRLPDPQNGKNALSHEIFLQKE